MQKEEEDHNISAYFFKSWWFQLHIMALWKSGIVIIVLYIWGEYHY